MSQQEYRPGLADALGNEALILEDRGQFHEALGLLERQEEICRELGDLG